MVNMLYTMIRNFRNDEEGQGLVEYGLILALISIVAIVTMGPLGTEVAAIFTSVTDSLTAA